MPAVLCRHLGGGDLCNHVIGRQDVSMLSIDDDARAGRLKFAFQLLRDIEKFPEKRIAVKRVFLFDVAMNGNVDHARRDLADQPERASARWRYREDATRQVWK